MIGKSIIKLHFKFVSDNIYLEKTASGTSQKTLSAKFGEMYVRFNTSIARISPLMFSVKPPHRKIYLSPTTSPKVGQ